MSVAPVAEAAAPLKDLLKDFLSPEMIRALSPTEGFEAKPHTFQAVESEGRWKTPPDFDAARWLQPPQKKLTAAKLRRATLLTIQVRTIDPKWIAQLVSLISQSMFPQTLLGTTALKAGSLVLPKAVQKVIPQLSRAIADLQTPATAEIEAVWWSDGLEIWWGQVAAKHVTGFGSLFGHQARVELDGVSYGNYFPLSYCVSFTGFVNPVGPVFEEIRGAVRVHADGGVDGLFCERSNRDKDHPEEVKYSGREKGYLLEYPEI